mgnify:CR=1
MNKFLYWILVIGAMLVSCVVFFIICFSCGDSDTVPTVIFVIVLFAIPITALFIKH